MSDSTPTAKGAWAGRILEVALDRMAHGGAGVGRVDGRVVFVRGGLPGERVRARVVDDRKAAFCHADVVEVLEPSPHRIDPACPAAAAGAGCCDLSYVTLHHSRELKAQILSDTLSRVGRITQVHPLVESLADPADHDGVGWRVRARLGVDGQGHAGFHRHRDAQLVTDRCVALHPQMYDTLDEHRYQPGSEIVVVRDTAEHVHVVEFADDLTSPVRTGADRRRAAAQRRRARSAAPRTEHLIAGASTATFNVGRRSWDVAATGFWQAHRRAPQVYSDAVVESVQRYRPDGAGVVWDLYGGVGVFTAVLLDADGSVSQAHVVDTDAAALRAAQASLDDRVTVHRGTAQAVAERLPTPDVVVLDPPRSGAGRDVVDAVTDADPKVIVHIGCDVAAFARDLGLFVDRGYRVAQVRGFDAFPRTHHIEAIATLVPGAG